MKNKNTKNAELIADIKKMVTQPAMAGVEFTCWRESWMELVKQLEKGYDYERRHGAWPGQAIKA
jgi:hypothetical protein